MNSSDLRPWQIRKIRRSLASLDRTLGYLSRLKRRMELTGFPPHDPLFRKTVSAQHALQDLMMELHYLSCESGVG